MSDEVPVLIVGGSLNGLSTALFLGTLGIRSMVVERHPSTTVQYKFRGISPRSMELYRSAGIEDEIRRRDSRDQMYGIARASNLSADDIHWTKLGWPDTTGLSPTEPATCDQDRLEPVLRSRAMELGAHIEFGTELTELENHERGVRALLHERASGTRRWVTADFLVAADGASSSIRERLGIGRRGPGVLQHWMNIIFDTDLEPTLGGRRFTSCFVTDVNGTILPRESSGRWLLAVQYLPERGERPDQFDAERCRTLVHRAAGRTDVRADVVDARPWEVAAGVVERFVDGRVFLVGDAAHVMPPTGGFGGNTGIQDAYDLAWKLAFVLQGRADSQLLASYDSERRPVAEATLAQALARLSAWFKDPNGRLPQPARIVEDRNVVFGQAYAEGAFVDPTPAAHEVFEDPGRPSGRPGTRAPHVVVARDGETLSTLDLFGKDFVVLSADRDRWRPACEAVSQAIGITLRAYGVGPDGGFEDVNHDWATKYGVGERGAVLVRPDGIVGWRSPDAVGDPGHVLEQALVRILGKRQSALADLADGRKGRLDGHTSP